MPPFVKTNMRITGGAAMANSSSSCNATQDEGRTFSGIEYGLGDNDIRPYYEINNTREIQ